MLQADDLLLEQRHAPRRHLDAEVAAGDHHRVGGFDDAGEVVDRGGGLDLGHQRRAHAALGEHGAHALDVFGAAHEREPEEVDLGGDRHFQRQGIAGGEGFDVRFGARQVHALARAQGAAANDFGAHVLPTDSSTRSTIAPSAR
jgi:hypothetical protein